MAQKDVGHKVPIHTLKTTEETMNLYNDAAGAHLVEGIWAVARAAATDQEDATNHAACIHGRRTLHRSPAGGVAPRERFWFSRERSWRRRASEAGARAATSRDSYPSTRVVGAGRTGPIRSASDAVGERPGLESGGSHRVTPARLATPRL